MLEKFISYRWRYFLLQPFVVTDIFVAQCVSTFDVVNCGAQNL